MAYGQAKVKTDIYMKLPMGTALSNVDGGGGTCWAGNWIKSAPNDLARALSRTGFLFTYTNCSIVWGSKMQTLVALSTMEAEFIVLSTVL